MKNNLTYLQHILDATEKITEFVAGFDYEKFVSDEKTVRAVIYTFAVIGEAANKLSKDFQTIHSEILWRDIIGMRHRLIHGYDDINFEIVWQAITKNIPELKLQIKKLMDL